MVKLQLEVGFFGTSPKTGNEESTLPNRKAITEMRGLVVRVDIYGVTLMWLRGNREVAKGAEISAFFTISTFKENALKMWNTHRILDFKKLRSHTYFKVFILV